MLLTIDMDGGGGRCRLVYRGGLGGRMDGWIEVGRICCVLMVQRAVSVFVLLSNVLILVILDEDCFLSF